MAPNGSPIRRSKPLSPSRRYAPFPQTRLVPRYVKTAKYKAVTNRPAVKPKSMPKTEHTHTAERSVVDQKISLVRQFTRISNAATKGMRDATTAHRLMANFITIYHATGGNSVLGVENRVVGGCMRVVQSCHEIVAVGTVLVTAAQEDDAVTGQVGTASQSVLLLCGEAISQAEMAGGLLERVSRSAGEERVKMIGKLLWNVRERVRDIQGRIEEVVDKGRRYGKRQPTCAISSK